MQTEGANAVGAVGGGTGSAEPPPSGGHSKRPLIIEAATNLFANKPYSDVLIDDVAHLANVGKGTVYRYFKDKEDLFASCISDALDKACEVLHGLRHDEALPYSERLARTIDALIDFYTVNQRLFHMLHHYRPAGSEEREKERHERWEKIRGVVERLIARGIEAGEFVEVEPHAATLAVMGAVRGLVHHVPEPALATATARVVLVHGLLKRRE